MPVDYHHHHHRATPQAQWPSKEVVLRGAFVTLVALREEHADDIWPTLALPDVLRAPWWPYLTGDPISTYDGLVTIIQGRQSREDGVWYAILDSSSSTGTQQAVGWVCLSYIDLPASQAEVGIFLPSPRMQRTPRATEAVFLLVRYAFDVLVFAELFWESHAENAASCRAAVRLGFEEVAAREDGEGKLARYRLNAQRWSDVVRRRLVEWLDAGNFDEEGRQVRKLEVG